MVTSPSGVERLAVGQGQLGARRDRGRESRTQPLMFWPRSTTWWPGDGLGDRDRPQFLDPTHGWGGGGAEVGEAVVGDGHRGPALQRDPEVDALPRHQVRPPDRPGGPGPGRVGGHDRAGPVRVVDVELAEEGERRAVAVVVAAVARLAAPPAVGEDHLQFVVAFVEERGHVVGLHLEPGRVAGRPRGQLQVADPDATEERLVDAVGGGVEPGPLDRTVEDELVAQDRGRAPSRLSGIATFVGLDPRRRPVGRVEQADLDHRGRRPRRSPTRHSRPAPPRSPVGRNTRSSAGHGTSTCSLELDPVLLDAVDAELVRLLPGRPLR